jgi:Bacterial PH domain
VKQDFHQFKELPAPLPVGERVIWQGKPTLKGLALRSFRIREVALYFGLLMLWRLWSSWSHGMPPAEAAVAALWLMIPAGCTIALLGCLAWLFRRATCYTITSRRVLFQFGVALPMTMNIPLSRIANAALKTYRDGSGDIPLQVLDSKRVSYLLLWPHIRPWRLRAPEPMLRSIPAAAAVAPKLAEALAAQTGSSAISQVKAGASDFASGPITHSAPGVAA